MKQNFQNSLFTLAIICISSCSPPQKVDFIIQNVKLFDGDSVFEEVDLMIEEGMIVEVGKNHISLEAEELIDGRGHTIIPPLIDAHAHISSLAQLKESLKAGVFTVLDLHSPPGVVDSLRILNGSLEYSTLLSSGPALTAAGGHGTQFGYTVPTVSQEDDPFTLVNERVKEGIDVIKIIREPKMRTLDFEAIDGLIKAAHHFNKPAIAHISLVEDAVRLAEMGIDGLSHIWLDRKITSEGLGKLQANKVFVIPTLLANKKGLEIGETNGWANYYLSLPEIQLELRKLQQAEILLLAGTDAPNFGTAFGSGLIEEIILLLASGLSEKEAIKAATVNPLSALGLDKNLLPKEGHQANFLLVEGDPLKNIDALKNIKAAWRDGKRVPL